VVHTIKEKNITTKVLQTIHTLILLQMTRSNTNSACFSSNPFTDLFPTTGAFVGGIRHTTSFWQGRGKARSKFSAPNQAVHLAHCSGTSLSDELTQHYRAF